MSDAESPSASRPHDDPAAETSQEQRRFRRINRSFVARVLAVDGHNKQVWNLVFIRNLSRGGMLFSSDEPYAVGALLDLSINIVSEKGRVRCSGKVIRLRETAEGQFHEVAVRFTKFYGRDQEILIEAIGDYLKKLDELGLR